MQLSTQNGQFTGRPAISRLRIVVSRMSTTWSPFMSPFPIAGADDFTVTVNESSKLPRLDWSEKETKICT